MHTYMHTYTHTRIHAYMHTYMHTCMHTHSDVVGFTNISSEIDSEKVSNMLERCVMRVLQIF